MSTSPRDRRPSGDARSAVGAFDAAIADSATAARVRFDEPLGPFTTYRVGGPAARFVPVDDDADLAAVVRAVSTSGVDVVVVGKGSNLLVADAGFSGVAIQLGGDFATVGVTFDVASVGGSRSGPRTATVRAGGAALLPVVARRTAAEGLTGFEWAVGVPGSIGGAVRMNAGGHGSDMAASLVRVRVVDLRLGEDGVVTTTTLALGYRSSAVAAHQVVAWAELQLQVGDRSRAEAEISEIVRWRREHQPGGQNAGSVFTNPAGVSAGRLIDESGCKGLRIGSAEVSPKHANFIQADVGGSADDVVLVMKEVQSRVLAASGVRLHAETRLVGFGDEMGEAL